MRNALMRFSFLADVLNILVSYVLDTLVNIRTLTTMSIAKLMKGMILLVLPDNISYGHTNGAESGIIMPIVSNESELPVKFRKHTASEKYAPIRRAN